MTDFKVGDKVRCVECVDRPGLTKGKCYTAEGLFEDPQYPRVIVVSDDGNNNLFFSRRFEKVEEEIDLTKLDTPFGQLDSDTKKALMAAWVDGETIEIFDRGEKVWKFVSNPAWYATGTYRVKPAPEEIDIQVPWESLIDDIKWVARDGDGWLWGFTHQPRRYVEDESWLSSGAFYCLDVVKINPGNKPWERSLVERPSDSLSWM